MSNSEEVLIETRRGVSAPFSVSSLSKWPTQRKQAADFLRLLLPLSAEQSRQQKEIKEMSDLLWN